jgi:hypothetical protein
MAVVTGKMVVAEARKHAGQGEDPVGSNRGLFVQKCQAATFLSGTGWPWCAAFVCRICELLGIPLNYPSAGAHDLANHYAARKVSHADAKPGMIVDYNIGSGHTGILTSISQDAVRSIDGNWADHVTEHRMPLSSVRGIWALPHVDYDQKLPDVAPPKKLPPWVATTSATGHKKVFRRKRGLIHWLQSRTFPNGITIKRAKNPTGGK